MERLIVPKKAKDGSFETKKRKITLTDMPRPQIQRQEPLKHKLLLPKLKGELQGQPWRYSAWLIDGALQMHFFCKPLWQKITYFPHILNDQSALCRIR